MKEKRKQVKMRIPRDLAVFYNQVSKMAGVSLSDTVNVVLAIYLITRGKK